MNYREMSDHQINVLVAKSLDGHADDKFPVQRRLQVFDPCNSWADGGPIIATNKISLIADDTTSDWSSASVQDYCDEGAFRFGNCHANPLRAAMIVFLLMQEKQNANS